MKRFAAISIIILFILSPIIAMGQDVPTLKRDLLQERVLRLQAELSLMRQSYKDGQEALKATQKELDAINAELKVKEPPKEK